MADSIDLTAPHKDSVIRSLTPRLVFFDLDGTLINSKFEVSSEDLAAVQRLTESGVTVCVATGRPLFGCRPLLQRLQLGTVCMFFSGALICSPDLKEIVWTQAIEVNLLQSFCAAILRKRLYLELYNQDGYFCFERNALTDLHAQYLGQRAELIALERIRELGSILKLVVICSAAEELDDYQHIAASFPELTTAVGSGSAHPQIAFANISSSNASREACFERICAHYQVCAEQVIAFGDGQADLAFIKAAGCGVAMGNACAELKAAADYVTCSVDQSGVSFALNKLLC